MPLFLCLMTELCHICVPFCSLRSHLKVCAGACSCQKTVLKSRSPPVLDCPKGDTWAPAAPPVHGRSSLPAPTHPGARAGRGR